MRLIKSDEYQKSDSFPTPPPRDLMGEEKRKNLFSSICKFFRCSFATKNFKIKSSKKKKNNKVIKENKRKHKRSRQVEIKFEVE